jgi:hypothetical protein
MPNPVLPLAHLTAPDVGLVAALMLAAAVLALWGVRWLERGRNK